MFRFRFLLIFFLLFNLTKSQSVRINELSSSNSIFFDEDGDSPDWIELYNYGTDEIFLNDWSISDIEDNNDPWLFPDISIKPNEYLLVWASDKDDSGIYFPRTLINIGESFKYIIPDENTDSQWMNADFNDDDWLTGASGFGYSDGDDNTNIPSGTISVFLRKKFTIESSENINQLVLDIDYDDGFVAYINGFEVARSNIGGSPPIFNSTTGFEREAQMYQGGSPERFILNNTNQFLIDGENILSIQVHNISDTSSDMTLIPFLSAYYNSQSEEGLFPPSILNFEEDLVVLHTDFKLSSSGESIFLKDDSGNNIDSITFGFLPTNISYGVSIENEEFVIFNNPSPGYQNDSNEYSGVLETGLTFSHDGGILESSILLEISGDGNEDQIRYTLDYTEPDLNSILYTGPITIDQTSIVRAKAFKNNFISLLSETRNYFFNIQSNHPIIHLVSDEYNLFDSEHGIYSYGNDYNSNFPYFGANFWQDWERPVNISYYSGNSLEFTANAGLKIFGAYSRGNDQKSFSLFARGEYGVGEFDYQFFDNLEYESFESLILRNSGNDWMRSNMRDVAITSLMTDSNIDYQSFKTVSSYLNSTYWGMYHLREKVSENMVASKHGINPDEVDMLTVSPDGVSVVDGDEDEYMQLQIFIEQNSLHTDENYDYVINQIDIDNYMEYHIAQIYMDNRDYPGNNVKFWKHPEGKWRWILYDTDFGFAGQWWSDWDQNYAYLFNTLDFVLSGNQTTWANPPGATLFLRKLTRNDQFKIKFINRFADEMNSRYLPSNVTSHFLEIYYNIYDELSNHIDRWSESQPWADLNSVYYYVDNMNNFAINRQPEVKLHILDHFSLNSYNEIILVNDEPEKGHIIINNNLKVRVNEWSGDYFEDIPITLRAVAEEGYEFSHWSGDIDSSEIEIQINVNQITNIEAHFSNASTLNIVINEINYKSSENFDPGDWIELFNPNADAIDISGWILKDNNDNNQYLFPQGTFINGEDYLVIVRNSDNFSQFYPEIDSFIGEFGFGLSSSEDAVRLFDSDLIIQDEVYYSSSSPWPPLANGQGYTLELIDPSYDNSLAQSWSNINYHGSPDSINSTTASLDDEDLFYTRVYPNPFFQTLFILLELDLSEFVTIDIFDLKGSLVNNIHSGVLNSGIQRIDKNLEKLNAGIYILKIKTASGLSQTEKIIKF